MSDEEDFHIERTEEGIRVTDKIADKILTKTIARRVKKLTDEKKKRVLPKLQALEAFFDEKLKEDEEQ